MAKSTFKLPTSAAQPPQWRWWRIDFSGSKSSLSGREQAVLSRHVLNLRASLVAPSPEPTHVQPVTKSTAKPRAAIDLIPRQIYISALALNDPWKLYYKRWPWLKEIAVVNLAEMLWWLLSHAWRGIVLAYLRLAEEFYVLADDIIHDVKEYLRLVHLVLTFPARHFVKPSQLAINIKPVVVLPHWGQISVFVALALLLTIPFKGWATLRTVEQRGQEASGLAHQAIRQLYDGGLKLSTGQAALAQKDFNQAARDLQQAQTALYFFPDKVMTLLAKIPGKAEELAAVNHLLAASRAVAQGAGVISSAWQTMSAQSSTVDSGIQPQLLKLQASFADLRAYLDTALAEISQIDKTTLPPDLQTAIAPLQDDLGQLQGLVDSFTGLPTFLQTILASTEPQRYVILFQNSTELRPTGGFAGSLALVEISNGQVTKLDIPGGGPYDFQGSLSRLVRPPEPLRLVRGTWQLQDANWFFDFPTSARKTLWFLEASGGPKADGVLAVTSDLVVDLLKVTGPIDLPQYGKHLTADNFLRETQKAVELEYDKQANRPKQFIGDLMPLLITRLLSLPSDQQFELVRLIDQNLSRRSLQLYMTKPELEDSLRAYGWAGEIKSSASDYLAVVRTNIGGGKTDGVIDESIKHQVTLNPTGELTAQLTLTRTHHGDPKDIFTSRRNVEYLRFYVPAGAVLLNAEGFSPPPPSYFRPVPAEAEIDEDLTNLEHEVTIDPVSGTRVTDEFGKTVFANWTALSPGQTQTMTLTYSLPLRLEQKIAWQDLRRYHIYFQRQAGVKPIDFSSSFKYPVGWRLRWQENSDKLQTIEQGIEFKSEWQQDEYYGLILERLP